MEAITTATKPIGNVNKYNLYGPCFNNLPPGRPMSRTRLVIRDPPLQIAFWRCFIFVKGTDESILNDNKKRNV